MTAESMEHIIVLNKEVKIAVWILDMMEQSIVHMIVTIIHLMMVLLIQSMIAV